MHVDVLQVARKNVKMNVRNNDMAYTSNNKYGESLWMTAKSGSDFGIKDITGIVGHHPFPSTHSKVGNDCIIRSVRPCSDCAFILIIV